MDSYVSLHPILILCLQHGPPCNCPCVNVPTPLKRSPSTIQSPCGFPSTQGPSTSQSPPNHSTGCLAFLKTCLGPYMNSYAEGYPSRHSRYGKLSSGSFLDSSTFDEVCFISAMSSIKDYYKFNRAKLTRLLQRI